MILELPLQTNNPHFDFFYTLDGVAYRFEIKYNTRDAAFFLNLFLEDDTPVFVGVKLVLDWPLGGRTRALRFPGMLILGDTSGKQTPPTLDDLGARVKLYYFDEAFMTTARAQVEPPFAPVVEVQL